MSRNKYAPDTTAAQATAEAYNRNLKDRAAKRRAQREEAKRLRRTA